MQIFHLKETDYKTGLWSGGSTTELFIWPKNSDYAKRKFMIRVSSARVDLEESDFTPLPNVTRYITPLLGGFTLIHPNGVSVEMNPLSPPYEFSGENPTHCVGKATDFNLMLQGTEGQMDLCNKVWQLRGGFNCLYAVTDTTIELKNKYTLKAGELLVAFADMEYKATVISDTSAIICFAKV